MNMQALHPGEKQLDGQVEFMRNEEIGFKGVGA